MAQTNATTAVWHVSITQGQTQSSSFRTRAASAFTAHGLIPLMQSKHVINGPSQPPLFVVRQTLKSNVSTMGEGGKSAGAAKSADERCFQPRCDFFHSTPTPTHFFSLNRQLVRFH